MSKFAALRTIISADAGNVAAKHEVRMQAVTHYYDVALRGNKTQLIDGLAFANSIKGNIAKAYVAGFQAAGMPEKYPYEGKLSAAVADEIAVKADELAALFSQAFAAIVPVEEAAPKSEEEKAKAKKEKADKAEAAHKEWAKENGFLHADDIKATALNELSAADILHAVTVNIGKFDASDLAQLIAKATAAMGKAQMNAAADTIDAKAEAAKAEAKERKAAKARADKLAAKEAALPEAVKAALPEAAEALKHSQPEESKPRYTGSLDNSVRLAAEASA